MTTDTRIEQEARQWAEQFKTGEWFENIRTEAYKAGALREQEKMKEFMDKEPLAFLLSNALRMLNDKQMVLHAKAIIERCSLKKVFEEKDNQIAGMKKDTDMWFEREKELTKEIEEKDKEITEILFYLDKMCDLGNLGISYMQDSDAYTEERVSLFEKQLEAAIECHNKFKQLLNLQK